MYVDTGGPHRDLGDRTITQGTGVSLSSFPTDLAVKTNNNMLQSRGAT